MLIVSVLGPIISAFSCFFLSRWVGSNILKLVLIIYVLSSISSISLLYYTIINDLTQVIHISQWSTYLAINLEVTINIINASLLSVVIVIGTCVISYTNYYMATDAHLYRFVGLLSSFVSFMALLAISSNLVVLFIGWELIGLFSYLLIGFWSDRTEASNAALSAMLTNKFGDYLLSLGLILTFSQISSLDVLSLNTIYSYFNTTNTNFLIGLLSVCYVIAAMAKSAQIGLHLWLIHAMQVVLGYIRQGESRLVKINPLSSLEIKIRYGIDKDYKFTVFENNPVDPKVIGAIMGCMLGDGHIRPGSSTKNGIRQGHARYSMTMGIISENYVNILKTTVFHLFSPSVTGYFPNVSLDKHSGKSLKQCTFSTKSSKYFTQLLLTDKIKI